MQGSFIVLLLKTIVNAKTQSFFRWLAASVSDSEKSSSSFVSSPSSFNMIGNQADPELAASSRFSM